MEPTRDPRLKKKSSAQIKPLTTSKLAGVGSEHNESDLQAIQTDEETKKNISAPSPTTANCTRVRMPQFDRMTMSPRNE
jgi:hypothetical protein